MMGSLAKGSKKLSIQYVSSLVTISPVYGLEEVMYLLGNLYYFYIVINYVVYIFFFISTTKTKEIIIKIGLFL